MILYATNCKCTRLHKQFAVVLLIHVRNMKQTSTPVAACWVIDLVGDKVRVPVRCSLQWAMQRNAKKNVIQNQFFVVYNTSQQCCIKTKNGLTHACECTRCIKRFVWTELTFMYICTYMYVCSYKIIIPILFAITILA